VSDATKQSPLLVAIDFKQPQSYLAKRPTEKLAAALGIEIDWQPMEERPFREPPPETSGDDRGARHRRFRARYFEHDLRRYAESQGLVLGDLRRATDSSVAAMGLLWAKKHAAKAGDTSVVDAYVDRVFEEHWGGTLALEQPDAIRGVLERVGVAANGFDPVSLRAEYEALLERWAAAGMVEAPAYLVGDEVFIGRAHLPMIEWLITGRTGPPPV
jgi:2-hydroxychromene-2-carboxylate isomerase